QLPHVRSSKMAWRRLVREALSTHRLASNHTNYGSITRLQEFGAVFQLFARMRITLLKLSKLADGVNHLNVKPASSIVGSFLLSPATMTRRILLTDTFLILKPTLSPERASLKVS
ncbi:hypothetical protein J0S82_017328, partial [Galemys pyrenaicus]